jgi:hypothetical protein
MIFKKKKRTNFCSCFSSFLLYWGLWIVDCGSVSQLAISDDSNNDFVSESDDIIVIVAALDESFSWTRFKDERSNHCESLVDRPLQTM